MGDRTSIEWAEATWSPTRGCSRVSAGCGGSDGGGCYAERQAHRFSGPGQPYEGLTRLTSGGPRWTGDVRLVPSMLDLPLRWKKPRRIFVDSMSDLFHEKLSNKDIAAVFGVMAACPQHTFLVLTKRAQRMRQWFEWVVADGQYPMDHGWPLTPIERCRQALFDAGPVRQDRAMQKRWPLPNVWLGVSVEDQATADERISHMLRCSAAVLWISLEPQIADVRFRPEWLRDQPCAPPCGPPIRHRGISWVVQGGESGPGARAFDLAWARSVRDQCKAAGTAYFLKQLGAHPGETMLTTDRRTSGEALADIGTSGMLEKLRQIPPGWTLTHVPDGPPRLGRHLRLRDRKGGDMAEWPEDLRVREYPR